MTKKMVEALNFGKNYSIVFKYYDGVQDPKRNMNFKLEIALNISNIEEKRNLVLKRLKKRTFACCINLLMPSVILKRR